MLQCVGSRDCTIHGNEHCSAICSCRHAPIVADQAARTPTPTSRSPTPTCARPARPTRSTTGWCRARRALRAQPHQRDHRGARQIGLRVRFEDTVTGRARRALRPRGALGRSGGLATEPPRSRTWPGCRRAAAGFIKEYHPKLRPWTPSEPACSSPGPLRTKEHP